MHITKYVSYFLFAILLTIIQILYNIDQVSLQNISTHTYIYIYPLFILIYPAWENIYFLLGVSFIMSIILDISMHTGAIYTISTTLTTFLKNYILYYINGKSATNTNCNIYKLTLIKKIFFIFILMNVQFISILIINIISIPVYENNLLMLKNSIINIAINTLLYSYIL
jgi:hypothetical protein